MKKIIKLIKTTVFSTIVGILVGLSPVMASDTPNIITAINPQTGDSNPLLPIIITLLALAVVGIIVGVVISIIAKKKKK